MTHPSDDIAANLDALFALVTVPDGEKQGRADDLVTACKSLAETLVEKLPDGSADREEALSLTRRVMERALSALNHEQPTEILPPESIL